MIEQEYPSRRRLKALYYKNIQLLVIRYPETSVDGLAISIKFAHYKGADNKPKLYMIASYPLVPRFNYLPSRTIFYFTPTRRLIFFFISIIISLIVYGSAFASSRLTSARVVFQAKN